MRMNTISMSHWIYGKGDGLLEEIENAVANTGWELSVSSTDKGPIEVTHTDGSIASLVQSSMTNTLAVEYEPGDAVDAGVNLNKRNYHHTSFGKNEGEAAVEWFVNVLTQHEKTN